MLEPCMHCGSETCTRVDPHPIERDALRAEVEALKAENAKLRAELKRRDDTIDSTTTVRIGRGERAHYVDVVLKRSQGHTMWSTTERVITAGCGPATVDKVRDINPDLPICGNCLRARRALAKEKARAER
jgi:hypothetical protein